MGRWFSDVYRIYCRLSKERLLNLSSRMSNSKSTQFLDGQAGFVHTGLDPALQQALDSNLLDVEPVEQSAPDEASGQVPEAELDDDDSDPDDEVDDGGESDDSDTESAVICGGGPLLTNAQISVGMAVAVPFTLDGRQVHFEGSWRRRPKTKSKNLRSGVCFSWWRSHQQASHRRHRRRFRR